MTIKLCANASVRFFILFFYYYFKGGGGQYDSPSLSLSSFRRTERQTNKLMASPKTKLKSLRDSDQISD